MTIKSSQTLVEEALREIKTISTDEAHNLVEDKTQFEGHKLINSNNCQGCHLIDDFGGQIADLIGEPEYSPPN